MPRILAVDDETICLEIIEFALIRNGFEVISVDNGDKAMEILTAGDKQIDLILLDMMMPSMDGVSTLENIRKNESTKNIPIIFQTGVYDYTSFIKVRDDMLYFIRKPYRKDDLIKLIKSVLEHNKVVS